MSLSTEATAALTEASVLYRQHAPISAVLHSMQSMGSNWLDWDAQEAFLKRVLLSAPALKFPPSTRYTVSLLRAYTEKVQAGAVEDVSDGLFGYLAELQPNGHATSGFLSFDLPSVDLPPRSRETTLAVRVEPQHNEVGLRMWEAGFLLTEYCLQRPEAVRGRSVVELGAGLGLTGMAAAVCCGAARVVLTDCAADVLENMADSLSRNGISHCEGNSAVEGPGRSDRCCPLEVIELDWMAGGAAALNSLRAEKGADCTTETRKSSTSIDSSDSNHLDSNGSKKNTTIADENYVVLAADVLYDPTVVPHFVNVVEALLKGSPSSCSADSNTPMMATSKAQNPSDQARQKKCNKAVVLVAATLRNPGTLQLFLDEVSRREIPLLESSFRWSSDSDPSRALKVAGGAGPSPFHFDPTSVRLFALGGEPDDGSHDDWTPITD